MVRVLLDTTVLIDILKGDKKATQKVDEVKSDMALYTTTVNIYEILKGIHILDKNKEKYLQALRILTHNINVLNIDFEVAGMAAVIYAQLRKIGKTIDEPDYLIAGACLSNSIYTIITRNEKHFKDIKGLKKIISY